MDSTIVILAPKPPAICILHCIRMLLLLSRRALLNPGLRSEPAVSSNKYSPPCHPFKGILTTTRIPTTIHVLLLAACGMLKPPADICLHKSQHPLPSRRRIQRLLLCARHFVLCARHCALWLVLPTSYITLGFIILTCPHCFSFCCPTSPAFYINRWHNTWRWLNLGRDEEKVRT